MSQYVPWRAQLDRTSPRYQEWLEILGSDTVPIEAPIASLAQLGEEKSVLVYILDFKALSPDQCERLATHVAKKFAVDPSDVLDQILDQINERGFPIRARDVVVAFGLRAFI